MNKPQTPSKARFLIPLLFIAGLMFGGYMLYDAEPEEDHGFELTFPGPEFYDSLRPIETGNQPTDAEPLRSDSVQRPANTNATKLTDLDWLAIEAVALQRYSLEAEADRAGLYKSSQEEAQIRQIYHLVRAATEWRLAHGN